MTGVTRERGTFREIARLKLADEHVTAALDSSTRRLMDHREQAWSDLPDVQALRDRAHEARMRVIDDLDAHVAKVPRRRRRERWQHRYREDGSGGERLHRRRLQPARREARRQVEVDGHGGNRTQ